MFNLLENIIEENAKAYYTTGNQTLSDMEFDAVVEKLKKEKPDSVFLKTGWGYKPDAENKIKHLYSHVGSLKKIKYTDTDVNDKEFQGESIFCISPKLDGLSVVLYYNMGCFYRALTRGDGDFGIDITEKVKHIIDFDKILDINDNFTGAVRGEIYMSPDSFKKYKTNNPEAKNHRSSAIGIINSDNINDDYKYLSLGIYTLIRTNKIVEYKERNIQIINDWLCSCFYPFVISFIYDYVNFDLDMDKTKLNNFKDLWLEKYNIDGLVLSLMEVKQNDDGTLNYYQKAYKFQDDVALTTVVAIQWEASKHNVYIPVICVEPIELEGTTVKKATGYNAKWVIDMGIKAGSKVLIQKANQIIPQIIRVINND